MNLRQEQLQQVTRRTFLKLSGQFSLGALALASILGEEKSPAAQAPGPLSSRSPHFQPKAKRVIYLHMSGGPPHLDLFDYKPDLVKWNSSPIFKSVWYYLI